MSLKRRDFLLFLGAGAGAIATQQIVGCTQQQFSLPGLPGSTALKFKPLLGTIPLPEVNAQAVTLKNETEAKNEKQVSKDALEVQINPYRQVAIADDLSLPEGFTYDVIAAWGDRVGDSRFGYNNDYLAFVETAPNQGVLAVNHEYISTLPWTESYAQVIGQSLPFEELKAAIVADGNKGIDAFSLPDDDPIKQQIQAISQEALLDLGLSIIAVRKDADGKWVRTNAASDRRISGIAGLKDGKYLQATGPAAAVFRKTSGRGYIDQLGDRIVGTNSNCSGGITPWGTVFSAEENFQTYFPESVHADGTSMPPKSKPFGIDDDEIYGLGNVFGLAGNKYGWMVEFDPANPQDYGKKHTWLGRYRHEAVALKVNAGKKLAVYSGCDRRSGHLYKFVSADVVKDVKDKANSQLFNTGMLYAAKFNPDGTGRWIALKADTPIDPDLPSVHSGKMINLPESDRSLGGVMRVKSDALIATYKQKFKTLGDLYIGNLEEQQGAILIDAHYAASAVGATCTARPEDTEVRQGALFVSFTSGSPSVDDGSPDARIFKGPQGQTPWEFGWIMRLDEDGDDPAAMTFRWQMLAAGGEPAAGGLGFANPDNLEFDAKGNLWIVTDMSSDKINKAVPTRMVEGQPVKQSDLRGVFGNNSIWYLPMTGDRAGEAFLFGSAPMDAEATGPFFTPDQKTLFLSVQHPGEIGGMRKDMAKEARQYAMTLPNGQAFMQTRDVPIGSNWPSNQPNQPPKPAVVAIRRIDSAEIS